MRQNVIKRIVLQDDKSCEVQRLKFPERDECVIRVHPAGRMIHRIKQLAKLRFTVGKDCPKNHEG